MTRKSKREIERALDTFDVDDPRSFSVVRAGVTAAFVSYEEDGGLSDTDVPEGWTASTIEGDAGVTYDVLEPADGGGDQA